MIPIHLDPAHVRIGLIGNHKLALNRLQWLRALDCEPKVWSLSPDPAFAMAAGESFVSGLPSGEELARLSVLWIADLEPALAGQIAQQARSLKVIVNVEDDLPFCDFHTPALIRRGKLLVSVGTSGASPAAAGYVRRVLEAALPSAWESVLSSLSQLRLSLRANGANPRDVIEASKARLAEPEIAQQIAPCGTPNCPLLLKARNVQ